MWNCWSRDELAEELTKINTLIILVPCEAFLAAPTSRITSCLNKWHLINRRWKCIFGIRIIGTGIMAVPLYSHILTRNSLETGRPWQGDIDVEAQTSTGAYLLWSSRAREEGAVVVAMDGDEENIRVVVEYLLSAVTMVNILRSKYCNNETLYLIYSFCFEDPLPKKGKNLPSPLSSLFSLSTVLISLPLRHYWSNRKPWIKKEMTRGHNCWLCTYCAWLGRAWCPGGLTNAKPFFTSPDTTLSASSITEPAACSGKQSSEHGRLALGVLFSWQFQQAIVAIIYRSLPCD